MNDLICEQHGSAMVLTMNRPEALNALSASLVAGLVREVEAAGRRSDVRAIVITGAGSRSFSAGMDLKERRGFSDAQRVAQSRSLIDLGNVLRTSPRPIIAAIGGWCLGGGFELALFCDVRIAADDAVFAFPEMTLGAYPGSGGAVTLPRLVGPGRAMDIFFAARRLDAQTALSYGIVEHLVPRAALLDAAVKLAQDFEKTSPLATAAMKRSILQGMNLPFEAAIEFDQAHRRPLDNSRDYTEGMSAHFEKRAPRFTGS